MKRFCTRATGPPQHGQTIVAAVAARPDGVDRDVMKCPAGSDTKRVDRRGRRSEATGSRLNRRSVVFYVYVETSACSDRRISRNTCSISGIWLLLSKKCAAPHRAAALRKGSSA